MLRRKDDKDLRYKTTMPPLHLAAEYGETLTMSNLISGGHNVDRKDLRGNTPLMHVLTTSENIPAIAHLLKANADIYSVTNANGKSALRMVIKMSKKWLTTHIPQLVPKKKHIEILYMFFQKIRYDYFVDEELTVQRLRDVNCPLALIPFMRSAILTKIFLEGNLMSRERIGCMTALHVAVLIRNLENVKILVGCGVDVNTTDDFIQTPLFMHSLKLPDREEKFEIMKVMLDRGASLYMIRSDGVSLMENFLQYGTSRTRLTVLDSKTNWLEKCRPNGETALHYMMENRRLCSDPTQEIRLLMSKGFDINMRNNKGLGAITFAMKHGHDKAVEYLLKNGAEVDWVQVVENTRMLETFSDRLSSNLVKNKNNFKDYQRIVELILLQRGIILQNLNRKMNEGRFSVKLISRVFMEVVLAHLTIAEAMGKLIPISVIERIVPKYVYREHFEICRKRIEEMKSIVVRDSVTLHQLLIANDKEIDTWICDEDFVSKLYDATGRRNHRNIYYLFVILQRVEHAIKYAELRKRSGSIICELTRLDRYGVDGQHYVVYKILGYLTRRDIYNIFEGRSLCESSTLAPNTRNVTVRTVMRKYVRHFKSLS